MSPPLRGYNEVSEMDKRHEQRLLRPYANAPSIYAANSFRCAQTFSKAAMY